MEIRLNRIIIITLSHAINVCFIFVVYHEQDTVLLRTVWDRAPFIRDMQHCFKIFGQELGLLANSSVPGLEVCK